MKCHVDKLIKQLENGATEPFEGVINNQEVVIKTFNNRFSNKVLINEFICLELAKLVGLTIPSGGVCIIDKDTILNDNLELDIAYEQIEIEGIGFYSNMVTSVTVFDSDEGVVPYLKNCNEINKIILFDYLIYNDDRHESNLLVSLKTSEMYIIDHSHVFKDKHNWTSESLNRNIENKDYKDINFLEQNYKLVYEAFLKAKIIKKEYLEEEVKIFKKVINKRALDDIFSKIPEEWTKDYEKDLVVLKKYILYRINNIEEGVSIIIDFMKMEGGIFYED